MTDKEIQRLRNICDEFKTFRDNTVDGEGKNLHDIKNSFDYVRKTINDYNLTGTAFGGELASKAERAGNVLSQLWLCLNNLETSVTAFCDQQERNNKRV